MRKISYKALTELERIEELSIMENHGPCYWGEKCGAVKSSVDCIIKFYDEVKDIRNLIADCWELDKYILVELEKDCPENLRKIIENNSTEASEKEVEVIKATKDSNLTNSIFTRETIPEN